MDNKHGLGLVRRGFGHASAEAPFLPMPVTGTGTRTGTGTGTGIGDEGKARQRDDRRNSQGHKYSSKKWARQRQYSDATGQHQQHQQRQQQWQPTQLLAHARSDLVETPRLDPSQSRQEQQQQQHQQQQHQQHQRTGTGTGARAGAAVAAGAAAATATAATAGIGAGAVSSSPTHPQSHVHSLVHPPPPPSSSPSPSPQAHPHSHPHPQPYRYPSQPPRLPPLAASLSVPLSPFDPFNTRDEDHYFLSAAASPAPATSHAISSIPRLPVHPDDIVSPISETRSSTPAFRSFDRGDESSAHPRSPVAKPLTRFPLHRQPTSHSSAGASLLDDRDFELSLGATERADHPAISPTRSVFAAVTSAVAHDVAHLTDEGSDDWFRFTARESTISRYTNSSRPDAHHITPVTMVTDEPIGHQQQQQQQQPQSDWFVTTTTSSSFVPLPPIRRTSTIDLLRTKVPLDDDSDTVPSPPAKDVPPVSSGPADAAQQASNGQLPVSQGALHSSPHSSVQLHPQPNLNLGPNPHGQGQSVISHQPNGLVPAGPAGQLGMPQNPAMQMPPPQMMMGRGAGPAGQQVAPGQMMINGQGQTFISLPGGRQWTVQESHLAEPLNPSNRNRPTNSPQSYSAYDKETEGEGLPPPHFSGVSSQSVHTRPRNASNPVPPTAATRFPSLFPITGQQQVFSRNQGQVPIPHHPLLRGQNPNARPRNSFDDGSLSKEMGVHGDQVSLPSIASEDVNDKQRRSSGPRFNLGHRRNSSGVTGAQQGHADAASEKKKNFFSSVTGMGHSQPKPKSNLGLARPSTFDEPDQVSFQNSGKGRLSELKGMIKGVGNAKEGAKDDQPVRIETVYEPRLSMQGPPRNEAAPSGMPGAQRQPVSFGSPVQSGPFGSQAQAHVPGPKASMQPHPSQMGQPVTTSPSPFVGVGRASTASPQPSQVQQMQSEENGKKSSSGGFLGGLFGKQGNKMKDAKLQSPQQIPPSSQRSPQPPSHVGHSAFRPGQMPLPGQQLGPHPMLAGQPPIQRGPPGQSPSPTLFQDPAHPPPSLETAQAITIRRPSEITLSTTQSHPGTHQSSSQRPNMPSPQGSQSTFKQQAVASPLGQRSIQIGMQNDSGIMASQTSPRLSDDSSLEKPTVGNPSGIPRFSPNRKPVGSGISKGEGAPMASVVAPGITGPDRSTASPSPRPIEQRAPSQLSQVQHTSQGRSSGMFNDMRQPSLPSPEPSPVPSQSNPSSSPRLQGDQFARHSLDPRESGPGLGVFPNGLGQPGPTNTSGPGSAPSGPAWGPNSIRPSIPPLASPTSAARAPPPRTPSSPVPSMDQNKLSKFFGAYDGGKPVAQPQANKEKSAASKFLGAFKRSSKQSEAPTSQPRPQTSPQMPQQALRPGVSGPAGPGGIPNSSGPPGPLAAPSGQTRVPPVQSGQGRGLTHTQPMQGGRGQPGQMPPPGMFVPAQAGRASVAPGIMAQGGRGQMPSMFVPGPAPPRLQRPAVPGKQGNEPQYDEVPIPKGYDAVYGYGSSGAPSSSPYNAGVPGYSFIQYVQYPPALQPGFPQQQWDPRIMQPPQVGLPPGVASGGPQMIAQVVPNTIPYQGAPQQPQVRGAIQNLSPIPQTFQPPAPQNQLPPQQFPQPQQVYQANQLSPSGQGQIPTQALQNPQIQPGQSPGQSFQQGSSPGSQFPSNTSWTGTPQSMQSPIFAQQPNPATSNPVPQPGIRAASVSDSPASSGTSSTQSQHGAPTISSQPSHLALTSSSHQPSPVNQAANPSTQVSTALSQEQRDVTRLPTQSPSSPTAGSGLLRSQDAARLTSRMSVSRHATNFDASFGPDKPADRTLTVSPEPPGPHHGPIHQVSQQTLSVNVERANSHVRQGSEDIYDATPRLDGSTPRGQGQGQGQADSEDGNTKYAGSEKGRGLANGTAASVGVGVAAGAAAAGAAAVTEDNMSFLDGPDSEPDDNSAPSTESKEGPAVSPQQRMATMNMEPEEKILVDQPVELAAVNDDDDGIPMMTATSYPGQEWNPYGAGEFGDFE